MIDLNTTNPLTYLQWKQHQGNTAAASELSLLYNNYLIDWKEQKEILTLNNTNYTKSIYTEFLKNLNLSTLRGNIQNFLDRIDTDDIYELELAVHYYVTIIRDLLKNTRDIREEAKFVKTKNNLKISDAGIKQYLKNFIIKLLSNKEFINENTNAENIDIWKISNNLSINLNSLATDNPILYTARDVDKNLVLDLRKRVLKENKKIIQTLSINRNGKKIKLKTNSFAGQVRNGRLGINQIFANYERLPLRYFRNENKTIDNLKFIYEKGFIEKYIANDLYYLQGNKQDFTIFRLFKHTNATNNLPQRYGANIANKLTNLQNKQYFPYQLSFNNTGVTNFYSTDLTIVVNLSAFAGSSYIIPDPTKYEPGVKVVGNVINEAGDVIRNINFKQKTPLIFKAKNAHYKNTDLGSTVNLYNNKVLRNFGYQSKENSLDYSHTGINRGEDNINFWQGRDHLKWKNTDTYPVSVLNSYPEQTRLDDLLISNKTGIKLRSDIYGNEFIFIKPVQPKRKAGTTYIETPAATTAPNITSFDVYDGLYFDTVLASISAAAYVNGTTYTSITGIYDTIVAHEEAGQYCFAPTYGNVGESFGGPLSSTACSALQNIETDEIVDGGPLIDHPSTSSELIKSYFTDTTIPYYSIDMTAIYTYSTTTYEASATNNPATSASHLFDQQYISAGEIYVRNVYTQTVDPLSTVMTNLFNKHSTLTKNTILNDGNILDFDIIGNTIYIQTSAETLTELYSFKDGVFKIGASSKAIVT